MVTLPRSRRTMPDTAHEPAHRQRERIRLTLLRERPELDGVIEEGPSGALVIPLPAGRCIEIGRMRRGGAVRWVVVREVDGRTLLSSARGPVDAARTALSALEDRTVSVGGRSGAAS